MATSRGMFMLQHTCPSCGGRGQIPEETCPTCRGQREVEVERKVKVTIEPGIYFIPMLLDERTDAFTAMGTSISRVWNNLPVMLAWGSIVLILTLFGLITGMLGLILVFPLLGHATWHAYLAIK